MTTPFIRITRAHPTPYMEGAKRLAHLGKVEAVGEDGTTVDISRAVANTEIELKPGEVERVRLTVLAFEVES